jgi:dTDP-4-amino-4,6-dideoxygalactose transaminase
VPLFDLDLGHEEYEAVEDVLDSGWITTGPCTKKFESAFAEFLGVQHAIAVSSGTAAMHLAHHALGLGAGDKVICPSLTFVATANAIAYTGAPPVFADITSSDDLTISPEDIESKIDGQTRGIVVMHYAGFPCDMDRVMEIARRHDLYVVEDAAHAPGAEYRAWGREHGAQAPGTKHRAPKVGTIGDIGCFSFFGNKNMTTAEGGMVVTNRDDLAEKVRMARSHGMTSLTWDRYKGHSFSYDVLDLGFNYRMDEIRAALGLAQLSKLDGKNNKRRALWSLYRQGLSDVDEIAIPFVDALETSSCHIFPVLLSEKINRKSLMEYLFQRGIQTSIHYPPVHLFSFYKSSLPAHRPLPLTEYVGKREVTLPLFPTMTEEQVFYVVGAIKDGVVQERG